MSTGESTLLAFAIFVAVIFAIAIGDLRAQVKDIWDWLAEERKLNK